MLLSFVTAFLLPARFTTPAQGELLGIFSPISRPTRGLMIAIDRYFHPAVTVDDGSPAKPREVQTVYQENHQLREQLVALELKFEALSKLDADRQAVGDIRPLCEPATVTGSEGSGLGQSLLITSSSSSARFDNRPVVHGTDLVGKVERAGMTGAHVRLITDPGFNLTARIGRYVTGPDGKLKMVLVEHLQPLVQGIGNGAMAVHSTISMQQTKENRIGINDFVVLDDRDDWPANLQGFMIGRIVSIRPQQNAPLFAEIRIEPATDLMRLTEVMVMVKE
jgi:cell shape-determining protein MreC